MTYYAYSDEGLIGEYDATGNVKKAYAWMPDNTWGTAPVLMVENGQTYYYHNDHLGTPMKLTDESGAIVWSATYAAFGEAVVSPSSTVTNNLRFPGQYFDAETGLHYNYHRYYNPKTGRYTQKDPIGLAGGDGNLYRYVLGDPVNGMDAAGLLAAGVSVELSTINPFSSGGGGSYGYNIEYTSSSGLHLYTFTTPNDVASVGFLPGVSLTGNIATGTGDWTGPFESGNGSYWFLTGGYFHTPADQADPGYFGLSLGGSLGFPGIGFTRTEYRRTFPDPTPVRQEPTPCK